MSPVDDITLSSYLDGELDYDRAQFITDQIYRDPDVSQKMVGMVTSQVLIKSFGREKEREPVPDKLVQTLYSKSNRKINLIGERKILQAAVVVSLFIGSFFLGRHNSRSLNFEASHFPVIPASLEQTINNTLEYQKSGSIQEWVEIDKGVSARVIPVRSFRSGEGQFYRMFSVDMQQAGSEQHFWGMAVRSGKGAWQTTGVFANGNPGSI